MVYKLKQSTLDNKNWTKQKRLINCRVGILIEKFSSRQELALSKNKESVTVRGLDRRKWLPAGHVQANRAPDQRAAGRKQFGHGAQLDYDQMKMKNSIICP